MFDKVPQELNFPREEREILALWREKKIFEKSLEERAGAPVFVFYEGPPTANGMPHNGHVLTRVIKDLFPRYKTMRGYQVPRKAGWDTHGLPVEVEVEKELRIHGKAAIEEYGVEPFVRKCVESVFRYTNEWETLTERVGFWVDLKEAYVTFHKSYVESVWWALSELFKKGLLYQGHKVVWWWAQGGTALSSGEVGLGYKTVDDPSVYVAFPLIDKPELSLLVWTTTPWTLPSNCYAAVHPEHTYVVVNGKWIVAKDLLEPLAKKLKTELTVDKEMKGTELVGLRYRPPFDLYEREIGNDGIYWRVIAADFVTLDTGTGIVHIAPAFGEDDFNAHKKVPGSDAVPLLCAVKPDGTFVAELERYAGRWVKDCDKPIQEELKERGLLVFAEQYRHDYPFCWRSDNDPLIQFARPAWYIRTTALIDHAIKNNRTIDWLPDHIKEGRFGDFLANNVDWALSRERYWGTPLNIWVNDVTGKMESPASVAEILQKNPNAFDHFKEPNEHLMVHKPWIDQVTWQNPGEPGTYRRIPEVIDCWFDSGAMPFAQWGYPHKGHAEFERSYPADFISEAIDQTRGWFYTLLMISTLLFDKAPFKTCIVLGHVSDKDGKKESKSKGNYTPPEVILDAVKMDFAVVEHPDAKPGVALIAREDLEGLDMQEGTKARIGGADFEIRAGKKMRRRIVGLHAEDRARLDVIPTRVPDVNPVEVPRLPQNERVAIEDPSSSAPGADAFRWFFYASSPPWSATRHSLTNVRALQKETLIKLRNVYSFFTIYANIDKFDATMDPPAERAELDRWILDLLGYTTLKVTEALDAYQVYDATKWIVDWVDALSNWYVRRSRDRFWKSGWDDDKKSAYVTLYECLVQTSRLMAPFTPFLAEQMYQNLVVKNAGEKLVPASVHLTTYPEPPKTFDHDLRGAMAAVRDVVSLGLQVRTSAKIKVRQPLRSARLVVSDAKVRDALPRYEAMIREELNVLSVELVPQANVREYVEYQLKPNFRTLGQKGLGKQAQELKKVLAATSPEDAAALVAEVLGTGTATVAGVPLAQEDLEIGFTTKPGFAAAGGRLGVVVLETTLDAELEDLGYAREIQNKIQTQRKEMGLEYTDRIKAVVTGGDQAKRVVERHGGHIAKECLAVDVAFRDGDEGVTIERA